MSLLADRIACSNYIAENDLDVEESKTDDQSPKDILTADAEPLIENVASSTYHKIIGICHFLLDGV